MRKVGPAIFCFALLSATLPWALPRYTLWMVPTSAVLIGALAFGRGIYLLKYGRAGAFPLLALGFLWFAVIFYFFQVAQGMGSIHQDE